VQSAIISVYLWVRPSVLHAWAFCWKFGSITKKYLHEQFFYSLILSYAEDHGEVLTESHDTETTNLQGAGNGNESLDGEAEYKQSFQGGGGLEYVVSAATQPIPLIVTVIFAGADEDKWEMKKIVDGQRRQVDGRRVLDATSKPDNRR